MSYIVYNKFRKRDLFKESDILNLIVSIPF
jgi:hypothetical protein